MEVVLLLLNKQTILFLSLSGILCLGSSLAEAAPTDNLQDTRRQAQERQVQAAQISIEDPYHRTPRSQKLYEKSEPKGFVRF